MAMTPEVFYEKYIKSCKRLKEVELPNIDYDAEVRIEKSLYDWRIYYKKSGRKGEGCLSCNSEWEARYLKVWLESGSSKIKMPKDEEKLKEVVPTLEKMAKRVKEILEEDLTGHNPKIQREVTHRIWEVAVQ